MSKTKKGSKPAKLPQPIKIKKEKLEEDRTLHPMSHFIDDRVELVKQIFGSLKTKTITNLAPEYLKKKDMDEIQELCLNELLCLSKKRLLSIINATKCPTDTESSEDSDVEAKEEHISLEEISSESDLENGDKSTKKAGLQSRTKKNPKRVNQADDKSGGDGQMSVLELLELQARARAIRSQLALEPVTKIEVDSDDDTIRNANVTSTTKEQKSNRKRKKNPTKDSEKDKPQSDLITQPSRDNSLSEPKEAIISQGEATVNSNEMEKIHNTNSGQKIKLKRNFRKQNQNVLEAESSDQENMKLPNLKKEKRSHSPSPDVIPIEPEPETLCISDSGSDKEESVSQPINDKQPIVDPTEEAEDGEIIENENSNITEDQHLGTPTVANNTVETTAKEIKEDTIENNKATILENEILEKSTEIQPTPTISNEDQKTPINDVKDSIDDRQENDENSALSAPRDHDIDGDHNDDVISIEGGDLETEMSEHLDKDNSSNSNHSGFNEERPEKKRNDDHDVISLDSSDNEDDCMQSENIESWHARYLKSSKVSKVLAVSRLGKRVRDKLKTSKLSKREIQDDINKEKEMNHFTSKHEEGSVEHYKELLELSHRKT